MYTNIREVSGASEAGTAAIGFSVILYDRKAKMVYRPLNQQCKPFDSFVSKGNK